MDQTLVFPYKIYFHLYDIYSFSKKKNNHNAMYCLQTITTNKNFQKSDVKFYTLNNWGAQRK